MSLLIFKIIKNNSIFYIDATGKRQTVVLSPKCHAHYLFLENNKKLTLRHITFLFNKNMELNEDVQLHILKFIPDKSNVLSTFQLTNKLYKNTLQYRLNNVYWGKVEKIVGKENADKMKQGSSYDGLLSLNNVTQGTQNCKILAPALAKMTSLKWFSLYNNKISDEECEILAPALAKMTTLTNLRLDNNNISDKGCEYLAPAFTKMSNLGWLHLSRNNIGDKGCEYLAPVLAKMTSLVLFHLWDNKIGDKGCEYLAPALAKMTALRWFDFYTNKIGDKGCDFLAPALAKMTVLEQLCLSKNNIGNKGCEYLAPALVKMTNLRQFWLLKTNIKEEGNALMRKEWKKAGKPAARLPHLPRLARGGTGTAWRRRPGSWTGLYI